MRSGVPHIHPAKPACATAVKKWAKSCKHSTSTSTLSQDYKLLRITQLASKGISSTPDAQSSFLGLTGRFLALRLARTTRHNVTRSCSHPRVQRGAQWLCRAYIPFDLFTSLSWILDDGHGDALNSMEKTVINLEPIWSEGVIWKR